MSGDEREGLRGIATSDLGVLLGLVRSGKLRCPVTRVALSSHSLEYLGQYVDLLAGLDQAGTEAVLKAVLAERECGPMTTVSLVWTGPEAKGSTSRDTAVVVTELFSQAQDSVLVAGYAFDHGPEILKPLHEGMKDRGVKASMFLDIPRISEPGVDVETQVSRWVADFLQANWPFGEPKPDMYYDPRTVAYGSTASIHAKCIVVDECRAFVTSANFTDRGQTRNIEVGVLVEDEGFATALAGQWVRSVKSGLLSSVG